MTEYALVAEPADGLRAVIRIESHPRPPEDPAGKGWRWLPVRRPGKEVWERLEQPAAVSAAATECVFQRAPLPVADMQALKLRALRERFQQWLDAGIAYPFTGGAARVRVARLDDRQNLAQKLATAAGMTATQRKAWKTSWDGVHEMDGVGVQAMATAVLARFEEAMGHHLRLKAAILAVADGKGAAKAVAEIDIDSGWPDADLT